MPRTVLTRSATFPAARPVFADQVLVHDHVHTATAMLFPGITRTTDMKAAVAAGIFQYQCGYQDHYLASMQARLVVT